MGSGQPVADLIFSGNAAERQAQLEAFCRRIHSDFYGNGRIGAMQAMQDFIVDFKATERERAKQHAENRRRMNLIIGLLGLLIALISASPLIRAMFKVSVDYLPHVITEHHMEQARAQDARN